eukprot:TRINITY_DN1104_c0_g1_i2.p1 TRINITY_DN1104_c0_g1~~TRINITY_DN1104_c0_g1_i2.p1  ORF type:complete len:443 (+),score=145.24 TRINITY_DN1104_c0_g1_i2:74-1330(+)
MCIRDRVSTQSTWGIFGKFKAMLSLRRFLNRDPSLLARKQTTAALLRNTFATGAHSAQSKAQKASEGHTGGIRAAYEKNVAEFKQRMAEFEQELTVPLQKPTARGYSHPYQSDHHPINFSPVKTAELFFDFVGPEQVSPHYENFMVARKFAIYIYTGVLFFIYAIGTIDLNWMAKSAALPFLFWYQLMYILLEGRKSFFKPLLVRFYRRLAANEIYNLESYYHENIENKVREQMHVAKAQIEYFTIHQNYLNIKTQSLNTFLTNEHLNLQRHIIDRTLNIFKQAQIYEESNQRAYLRDILERAATEIDKQLAGADKENIEKQMLESAIEGLRKGYMDYQNDPILPLVRQNIAREVSRLKALSQTEQSKLVALTESQIQSIRDSDRKAKEDFLTVEPKGLDNALKANPNVRRVLNSWGK